MIVIFDSGIGGKTLVSAIKKRLPGERVLFVSDSEHCPYGEKSVSEVRKLVLMKLKNHLESKSTTIVVLACNTATVAAIDWLREFYRKINFVGMVPAIKPAVEWSKNKKIGVLATPMTVHSPTYKKLIRQFAKGATVYSVGCKGLARAIEDKDKKKTAVLLKKYLGPLKKQGIDTLVLGCTHYILVRPQIKRILGRGVKVIDSNDAVVSRIADFL
ncbi:glutamate racemase [Candidatus Berkelbacteria bacterium]|nr:glutamate racemase [Candidatus Berkelbacteria bacterium]